MVATTMTRDDGQHQHDNQHDNQYDSNTTTTATMNVAALVVVPSERRPQRGHPVGVGREVSDRVKEATVIGTEGRLRCLAAMVNGELLGMTPGEDVGGEERARKLVPSSSQETTI
jgi:shikimate kinase